MTITGILFSLFLGTLLLCTILGMMVYKKISPDYRPMVIFGWACFAIQFADAFFLPPGNFILHHISPLLELALICWQAKRWHVFDRRPGVLWAILVFAVALWAFENLTWAELNTEISWFSVAAYFIISLIGIEIMNRAMIYDGGLLFRNARFLFSIGLILFYIFSGLLEVFMLIGKYSGKDMLYTVFYFCMVIGTITNIIYLRSFLCIPPKSSFTIS